jgi:hypothetical protein
MNQSIITDLVCIDCNANLMRDLTDNALFDTAKGIFGTYCHGNDTWGGHRIERPAVITNVCKECEMAITWNAETTDWESADERSCQQVGSTITSFYQQHEPA